MSFKLLKKQLNAHEERLRARIGAARAGVRAEAVAPRRHVRTAQRRAAPVHRTHAGCGHLWQTRTESQSASRPSGARSRRRRVTTLDKHAAHERRARQRRMATLEENRKVLRATRQRRRESDK